MDSETSGGVDHITIDGTVVGCDIETQKVITVRNDGVVVGETVGGSNEVIADALGDRVYDKFVETKSQEYDEFRVDVSQWELDRYLATY